MLTLVLSLPLALLPGQIGSAAAAVHRRCPPALSAATTAASPVNVPKIESACGFDYVPLLTALQAGEFREADQLTRDALITFAGKRAIERGYVYFTEAPKLPIEDMATLDRLWQAYSGGKFGYSVQSRCYDSKKVNRNLDELFARVGWKHKDGSLLRWLPEASGDEFIYDVEKAPKGHLPLTSTLRGQQLLEGLLTHDAWALEEFADVTW